MIATIQLSITEGPSLQAAKLGKFVKLAAASGKTPDEFLADLICREVDGEPKPKRGKSKHAACSMITELFSTDEVFRIDRAARKLGVASMRVFVRGAILKRVNEVEATADSTSGFAPVDVDACIRRSARTEGKSPALLADLQSSGPIPPESGHPQAPRNIGDAAPSAPPRPAGGLESAPRPSALNEVPPPSCGDEIPPAAAGQA